MVDVLIPKGYYQVAHTDFEIPGTLATIYHNSKERKFFIVVDEQFPIGPLMRSQLEVLHHVITDALSMRNLM
jgi:hypothetical protein